MQELSGLPVNVVQELHRAKKELDSAGVALPEKFATLPYTINLDNPLNEEGDTLLDVIVNPNANWRMPIYQLKIL